MKFEIRRMKEGETVELEADNWEVQGLWVLLQDEVPISDTVEVVQKKQYRITSLYSSDGLVVTFLPEDE